MADELLITGQTGLKNVSAEAIRELLSGLAGTGQYVLKGFTCTLNGTTAVNVAGGVALFNGAEVYLKKTGQSVAISAGASGTNRRDLIVLRFTRTSQQDTQKESCSIVYLKGTAASSPKDPTYNTGSILDGTATVDMPLARITWTGVTPTIANIANKLQSADDFRDSISQTKIGVWYVRKYPDGFAEAYTGVDKTGTFDGWSFVQSWGYSYLGGKGGGYQASPTIDLPFTFVEVYDLGATIACGNGSTGAVALFTGNESSAIDNVTKFPQFFVARQSQDKSATNLRVRRWIKGRWK